MASPWTRRSNESSTSSLRYAHSSRSAATSSSLITPARAAMGGDGRRNAAPLKRCVRVERHRGGRHKLSRNPPISTIAHPTAKGPDDVHPRSGGEWRQQADERLTCRLLRTGRQWPSGRRAAKQRDESAASHSITSSARASTVVGISRPSALAVFRLMTSSYLVGACTGRSAAFSPLRMRST
jgi:hypothetical protein